MNSNQYDIQFLCSCSIDEIWIRSTAIKCFQKGLKIIVTIIGDFNNNIEEIYKSYGIEIVFFLEESSDNNYYSASSINSKLVITASGGINRSFFPTKAKYLVLMPHSLVSLHLVYPINDFDGYDAIFCCGPHHFKEAKEIAKKRNLNFKLYKVGYGKLDLLKETYVNILQEDINKSIEIMIAPSWGPDNLLDKLSIDLVNELTELNYQIVVRPHPLFFVDSIISGFDNSIMNKLDNLANKNLNLKIENPMDIGKGLFTSSLLINDYSGTGLEYVALRKKRIISVDLGLKETNKSWKSYGLDPIEISIRDKIGLISLPTLYEIKKNIKKILEQNSLIPDDTINLFIYNLNSYCSDNAFIALQKLMSESI